LILGFAAVGFFLPLGMLVYYALSHTAAGKFYVELCPTCMTSIALDNAGVLTALLGWLAICTMNALLYAVPGVLLSLAIGLIRRNHAG
jgi:hypothetical protein